MDVKPNFKEAELTGISFGLLDDQELTRRAVFTLSDNPCPYKRNHPVLDSVTDPRLGSTLSCVACSTCSQGPLDCGGHLGRIKLAIPCAIGAFLQYLDMILTCFCYRCSSLLVPETNVKLIAFRKIDVPETIGFEKAIRVMYTQALKARICGTQAGDELLSPAQILHRNKKHQGCGARNPLYWIRVVDVLLRPVWHDENPPPVTMETIYSMLQNIRAEDARMLGFNAPRAPLSALVVRYFILPPLLIRPSRNRRSADDLTERLENIVRVNKVVADTPRSGNLSLTTTDTGLTCYGTKFFECKGEETYAKTDRVRRSAAKQPLVPKQLAMLFELQRQIAGFTFSKLNQKKDLDYGRMKGCISDKFAASQNGEHKGIMRGNLMGKRADYSARAPVSPDTDIPFDCVGVPILICRALTKQEIVTKLNYSHLLATVLRGQQYPGANKVTRNGKDFEVPGFAENGLQIGDIVHRHLIKGDWGLVNRQPTLHRYSMMALRVVPMSFGFSFRISLLLTVAYALDYDGDEMNFLVLPNEKATAEAMILMAAGENMYRNGGLIIQLVQHAALGVFMLTKDTCMLTKEFAFQLCMVSGLGDYIYSRLDGAQFPLSGREFLSRLLGKMFYDGKRQLKKSDANFVLGNVIRWFGEGVEILSGYCRMFETFAQLSGTTLSFHDCYVEKPAWLLEELATIQSKVQRIEDEQKGIDEKDFVLSNKVEEHIKTLLDKGRDLIGNYVRGQLQERPYHPLLDITESGAKGDMSHVIQNTGILGQQLKHSCGRLSVMTPHVTKDMASSRGFITRCFAEGLTSLDFYRHTVAARQGLVDTAVMIKRTGYLFRRMCKALEDCVVVTDNSARTQSGLMVLSSFGFDTTYLKVVQVSVVDMSVDAVQSRFFFPYGQLAQREVDALLFIRSRVLYSKHVHRYVALPIQWDMLKYVLIEQESKQQSDIQMELFADLVRMTVTKAWCRMVMEFHLPSIDLIRLSYQENMSVYNLVHVFGMRSIDQLTRVVRHVIRELTTNLTQHGTPIGPLVSEDFCAPVSQMSLKSFHHAGEASELSGGLDRIEEVLTLASKIATPSMRLYPIQQDFDATTLIQLRLIDISRGWLNHAFDENVMQIQMDDTVVCCILLKKDLLIEREISPETVCEFVRNHPQMDVTAQITYSDILADIWWVCIQLNAKSKFLCYDKKRVLKNLPHATLAANAYYKLTLGDSGRLLAGVRHITDFYETTEKVNSISPAGEFTKTKRKVIVTRGTNMFEISRTDDPHILHHKNFVTHLTKSNDIINEIYYLYGIDAACKAIEDELVQVMLANAASVSRVHVRLIAAFMCVTGVPRALTFAGMSAACANKLKLCTHERLFFCFFVF